MPGFLIYGANGYTGALIAREAVVHGHRPILAGRNAAALATLAGELGLEHRVFALDSPGELSRGTATTMAENIHRGGLVRQNGVMNRVPAAWKTRVIDFGAGPVQAVTIPWGDVFTAYHSTGIANVEVYTAAPLGMRLAAR